MTLDEYRTLRIGDLRSSSFRVSKYVNSLTLLAYSFPGDPDGLAFDAVEFAILQSWKTLGMLTTVLVVHKPFRKAIEFAALHSMVKIQVEPTLIPGDINSMSLDCDSRLATRFDTDYCLVVQDDGFPLYDALDEYLGKWDFIGAPYVRLSSGWRIAACSLLGYWMSNGGFSLRSKKLCEYAACEWKRKFRFLHPSAATVEDLYFTRTLWMSNPFFRYRFRVAPAAVALGFSYDAAVSQPIRKCPMGFHRALTFSELSDLKLLTI